MADGAQADLQRLLFATLMGSATVMAEAGGVYDYVPADPFKGKTAYISFGPSDVIDDSADCFTSGTHTFQLDVWSTAPGNVQARRIVDAIHKLLHEQELVLKDNALAEIRVDFRRVITDSDGLTSHGIVSVTAMIEDVD